MWTMNQTVEGSAAAVCRQMNTTLTSMLKCSLINRFSWHIELKKVLILNLKIKTEIENVFSEGVFQVAWQIKSKANTNKLNPTEDTD